MTDAIIIAMHPADQFEAFRKLIDAGSSTADVAARFGVPEKLIAQRLRLGRLSPVILDAYRNGEIGFEAAKAFAITDDQAAQERVFLDLTELDCDARTVRRILTEGEVRPSDKRVRFIGLDTYLAAGGTVRHYPERTALSEAQQDEFDQLSAEYDQLIDRELELDTERLAFIERRLNELTTMSECWSAETLSLAGAIIFIKSLNYQSVRKPCSRSRSCRPFAPDLRTYPNERTSARHNPELGKRFGDQVMLLKSWLLRSAPRSCAPNRASRRTSALTMRSTSANGRRS